MKKITLITVLMLFLSLEMFAQKVDTTLVINNHEICIEDNKEQIDITIYALDEGVRTTENPLFEGVFVKNDGLVGSYKNVTYAFKNKIVEFDDDNFSFINHSRSLANCLPSIYFSHLGMFDGTTGEQPAGLKQRTGSFEWGFNYHATIFCTKNKHFGMTAGLGISNSYHFLKNDYVLMQNNGSLYQQKVSELVLGNTNGHDDIVGAGVTKSYLRYWSAHLPLMLQLQWKPNGHVFMVSAGADLEWRFGMRSFARYCGSKHTMASDIDYNPIGLNGIFQVSFANVTIISRLGLTEMLKINTDASGENSLPINQWSLGIGLCFD